MSTTRKTTSSTYHCFQLLKNGGLSLSGVGIVCYLRLDLINPVKTIKKPNTRPISNPTLILFIKIPTTNPSTIAKMKAISPLRILGFF